MYNCNLVEPYIKNVINQRIVAHNHMIEYKGYMSFNAIMSVILIGGIIIFLYTTRLYKPTNDEIRENNIKKYSYIQDKIKYVSTTRAWNDHPEIPTLYGTK
jgi:hypothetical protein